MSCRTDMVSVRTSTSRRQLRVVVSPGGVQAPLPPSHSDWFCQTTVWVRESVSRRTVEPACAAAGDVSQLLVMGSSRVETVTGLTPGTPLMLHTVTVLLE